ncbi:unnamed protein product [Nezara viridula]|uniref:Uncharacterized protein n=1 Tax=Nezara viridula TaxID=85310 RepID=A0A9P0MSW0_NEZVI|nr:unnamed protein product [Nezara viridula]
MISDRISSSSTSHSPQVSHFCSCYSATVLVQWDPAFASIEKSRGQPDRSAMEEPHPGGTAFMITVTPTPENCLLSYEEVSADKGENSIRSRRLSSWATKRGGHELGGETRRTRLPAPPSISWLGLISGQPDRSAMEEPHPGGTAFMITVTPTPENCLLSYEEVSADKGENSIRSRRLSSWATKRGGHELGGETRRTRLPAPPSISWLGLISGQPDRSAMEEPHPGGTAFMITVTPTPENCLLSYEEVSADKGENSIRSRRLSSWATKRGGHELGGETRRTRLPAPPSISWLGLISGQPDRSAMEEPHPGGTAFMITVTPTPENCLLSYEEVSADKGENSIRSRRLSSWATKRGGHELGGETRRTRLPAPPSISWLGLISGQPDRSAMEEPHPGGTAFMITVTPTPENCLLSYEEVSADKGENSIRSRRLSSWATKRGGHELGGETRRTRLPAPPSISWLGLISGQPDRSAMEEPHPGGTAFMITVTPTPENCLLSYEEVSADKGENSIRSRRLSSWATKRGGHELGGETRRTRLPAPPSISWLGLISGQPDRSAMEEPHPGGTAFMITVTPTPGKYAQFRDHGLLVNSAPTGTMGTDQQL